MQRITANNPFVTLTVACPVECIPVNTSSPSRQVRVRFPRPGGEKFISFFFHLRVISFADIYRLAARESPVNSIMCAVRHMCMGCASG